MILLNTMTNRWTQQYEPKRQLHGSAQTLAVDDDATTQGQKP